jgi:hypothetical protein
MFKVATVQDPVDFISPFFPQMFRNTFRSYGLDFPELLPLGHLTLTDKNVTELCLSKTAACTSNLQVMADVDGDENLALASVSDDKVMILAQAALGDHLLNISVRRGSDHKFAKAVTYRLHVPENCGEIATSGFPQVRDAYRTMYACLETPLSSSLQPGLHRFRFRLPAEMSQAKMTIMTGAKEGGQIHHHMDGSFEGDVQVSPPEAILQLSSASPPKPLLRWSVSNASSAAPPLTMQKQVSQ